jgi:hypothetical protein
MTSFESTIKGPTEEVAQAPSLFVCSEFWELCGNFLSRSKSDQRSRNHNSHNVLTVSIITILFIRSYTRRTGNSAVFGVRRFSGYYANQYSRNTKSQWPTTTIQATSSVSYEVQFENYNSSLGLATRFFLGDPAFRRTASNTRATNNFTATRKDRLLA